MHVLAASDFNKAHEIAFSGVIDTLQGEGKVNGTNVAAFSIWWFSFFQIVGFLFDGGHFGLCWERT